MRQLIASLLHPFIRPQPIRQSLVLLALFVALGVAIAFWGADETTVRLGPLTVWLEDTGPPPARGDVHGAGPR